MNVLRKTTLGLAALSMAAMGFAGTAFAGDKADEAVGTWLRPKFGWHVEFAMCETDATKLCGTVISGEGVDKKTQETVVGVKILFNMDKTNDGSKWKGKMYNPADGKVYAGYVKILDDGCVKMSGCMMGFMCRSEKWTKVVAD